MADMTCRETVEQSCCIVFFTPSSTFHFVCSLLGTTGTNANNRAVNPTSLKVIMRALEVNKRVYPPQLLYFYYEGLDR